MIIGNLKNTETYEHIHPLFRLAFEYLQSTDFMKVEVGKVDLKGEDLFAIISDSSLKMKDTAKLELHNRYIDIQMPVSIAETFGWKSRSDLEKEQQPYDEKKDIQFFDDEALTAFTLFPDKNFVIFFPEDAHAPCIGEGKVRKVVVKIKI